MVDGCAAAALELKAESSVRVLTELWRVVSALNASWMHHRSGVEALAMLTSLRLVQTAPIIAPANTVCRVPHCDHSPSAVHVVAVLLSPGLEPAQGEW